jgi:hypothetical protein
MPNSRRQPMATLAALLSSMTALALVSGCDSGTEAPQAAAVESAEIGIYRSGLEDLGEIMGASIDSDDVIELRLQLRGLDGQALANRPVSAHSLTGNLMVPAEPRTDALGWATLTVYPRLPGEDRVSFGYGRVAHAELELYVHARDLAHRDGHESGDPAASSEIDGVLPWRMLTGIETRDGPEGLPVPVFGAEQRALDGQSVRIHGYMLPLESGTRIRHFLLLRSAPSCFFCMPGGAEEIVEVESAVAMPFTLDPVVMAGILTLQEEAHAGVFYRLTAATPDPLIGLR